MKQKIRNKWKRVTSMCLAMQMIITVPAAGQTLPKISGSEILNTGHYAAAINPTVGGGSLSLSKNSDTASAWNTMDEALIPGTTMFWEGENHFRGAEIATEMSMKSLSETYGVQGVKLGNEVHGVKSWFLFGSEILCAGAGLQAQTENSGQIITIVDNIPVTKDTKLALTNPSNGYRNVLTASANQGVWSSLINTPTKGVHTQRNWLSASALSDNKLEWSYVFGDGETGSHLSASNVYYRLNTKESDKARLAEFFIAPGETYQYTMVAGKTTSDYSNSSLYRTDARLLMNTPQIQAASSTGEGIVSVNKWSSGSIRLDNQVVPLTMNECMALTVKKDPSTGNITLNIAKPDSQNDGYPEVTLETRGTRILTNSNPTALAESAFNSQISLKFDASKMGTEPVVLTIEGKAAETVTGDAIVLVRGEEGRIEKPDELSGSIQWEVKIPKGDGNYVRNAGSSKIKRELLEGETDGTRKAGDTDGSHIASVRKLSDEGALLTANEKGVVTVLATDEGGKQKKWNVTVLYEDPANLPQAEPEDYEIIRKRWKDSLIGNDLTELDGGSEILDDIQAQAKSAWEAYDYKGQNSCDKIPWPQDEGAAGNPDIPFEDDAVEFRPAFKKVLAMAKAYAAKGNLYYQNDELLKDMKQILNYLCSRCYSSKTQTDNWWTWEIGVPKDLIPILVLLYDQLTEEEISLYTEGLYFFQPDPYHEGIIGTGSTHAQGYRTAQGANIIDCSRIALGLGILREDNELVYLAQKASSETFIIQSLKDSTKIADQGYISGFYADGSYLDHSHVPYLGSYGIEFLKGGAGMPPLFAGTPWEYPREVQENLEFYLKEGFLNGMYDGLMLDSLKGRSVSRPAGSNRDSGREAMILMIQLMDSVSIEVQDELKSSLKAWMEIDPGFIETLSGAEYIMIKAKALDILEDDSITTSIASIHKNLPLMDRAIHRTDKFLMALSMYSERIQNTEIMNHENRYGWHQGSGMTYLYNQDTMQYTENFWNTVNPLRLAGTTLVSKNIGNGQPDSSSFAQGGDFRSRESWVGGTTIENDGINGMSLTGEVRVKEGEGSPAVTYSPHLSGKKSWFMLGEQIVCLGAGITNSGEEYPVESIIENRRLRQEGDNALIINGEKKDLMTESASLEDIVEGKVDVSGTTLSDVSWAHLEGNTAGSDIGYYFPSGSQTISVRKARNAGDWSLVGTSNGKAEENYLEMWFDHGKNPENAAYEYVLLPGMTSEETQEYSREPQITVLTNTPQMQAVYSRAENILGANIWTDSAAKIGDLSIKGAASLMAKEDENGILTVSVSDPTMKNIGTIVVEIKKPVTEILSSDENVTAELTEYGAKLTIQAKGTNGSSSYATMQLAASLYPQAVTLAPGQSMSFAVNDYSNDVGNISWKVEGDKPLESGTGIDGEGCLEIDDYEENTRLKVTAELENGTAFQAFVSLGGKSETELPKNIQKVQSLIENAVSEALSNDDYSNYKVQKAIRSAVNALTAVSNEELAKYMMNQLITLEELYKAAMAANDCMIDSMVDTTETGMTGIEIAGAALSIPIKITESSASPSNAIRATASDAAKASPSSAFRIFADEDDDQEVRLAVMSVIDSSVSETEEEYRKSFELQLQLEDKHGTRRPLSLTAPVKVWMDIPEQGNNWNSIIAIFNGSDGKQRQLPIYQDHGRNKISFVMTDNGTVTLIITGSNGGEEERFQVSTDESLEGGRITANISEGKKGTKVMVRAVPDIGYRLRHLSVNGKNVSPDKTGKYEFLLQQDTYITGEFRKISLNEEGSSDSAAEVSGWKKANGKWYYFNDKGVKMTGWLFDNGKWFRLGSDGAMETGWIYDQMDGCWYYLDSSGKMAEGWICIDEKWYYFTPQAEGSSGWTLNEGKWEYKKPEGHSRSRGSLYMNAMTPDGRQVDSNGVWIQ
ncbi:polysaccharide lyase family 8 super-sandwich domain-containing protein [Lacrimispora indolis]|uniref:polysaccharide lyase family 8 super-sandwich domain-containing protein n=1 Tax=Lacrimispora indolis TaxID=69825 RepID=UPI0006866CA5|nr:polysaccharide lyase family 8 super-sandwich domain-containing protein [Lacrimispora indolis]